MDGHAEVPARLQRTLFPDAFEVQAASLAALRDLDVPRARRLLEQARRHDPLLVNLDVIDAALGLLESSLGARTPDRACLADIVLAVREQHVAGRLHRAAAEFVDQTIARYWKRHGSPGPFLDEREQVHRGVLDLALGDASRARRHLDASLEAGHQRRADLWAYLGDACTELGRSSEANAGYVRALLLAAADVDLMRMRHRPLVQLHEELSRAHPEDHARELLLVHAWLQGILEIPTENGWLDGQIGQLRVRARADPASPPAERCRLFALLLYVDRSEPPGRVDLAQRREMAALDVELFERYMNQCRTRERG